MDKCLNAQMDKQTDGQKDKCAMDKQTKGANGQMDDHIIKWTKGQMKMVK